MRTMPSGIKRSIRVAGVVCLLSAFACLSHASEGVKVNVLASVSADELMGRFRQPSGLFYDENRQRLYIADSVNRRIVSLDSEFRYLAELSKKEILLPVGLVRDSRGIFYVVDAERGEVLVVDVKAEQTAPYPLLLSGVPKGTDLFVPGRIAIDGKDNLYIIDRLNKRIIIADTAGAFVRSVTVTDKGFSGFADIRVDGEGYLYALDTIGRKVYVFNSRGSLVSSFGGMVDNNSGMVDNNKSLFLFPVSLAVSKAGFVYVLDRHAGRIMVFSRAGGLQYAISRKGAHDGELWTPSYLSINDAGEICIIDGDRVQVFKEVKE